jgi:hypothetical protein
MLQLLDMPAPKLSRKPLLEFIALCADITLAKIDALFAGNGLTARTEDFIPEEWAQTGGERRYRAAEYLAAIDMADEVQRTRLLCVLDDALAKHVYGGFSEDENSELRRLLRRDGVKFEDGEVVPEQLQVPDQPKGHLETVLPDFSTITDVDVLRIHAVRMQRATVVTADAPDAILAARELLESVCKQICAAYGITVPKNPNAGGLYKLAARPLGLDAKDVPDSDPATRAAQNVLTGLVKVAEGLGELRTRVGRGHGHAEASSARNRHADLAVGAAATLVVFLLDTWQDRKTKEVAVEF